MYVFTFSFSLRHSALSHASSALSSNSGVKCRELFQTTTLIFRSFPPSASRRSPSRRGGNRRTRTSKHWHWQQHRMHTSTAHRTAPALAHVWDRRCRHYFTSPPTPRRRHLFYRPAPCVPLSLRGASVKYPKNIHNIANALSGTVGNCLRRQNEQNHRAQK